MNEAAVWIYILVAIGIVIWEVFRPRRRVIDALAFANLLFLLAYCATPAAMLLQWYDAEQLRLITSGSFGRAMTPWLVGIGFICLQVGWLLGQRYFANRYILSLTSKGLAVRYSLLLLIVFALSLFIFVSRFGGYRGALLMGDNLRYEVLETDWRAAGSRFFPIVTVLLYYWVATYIICRKMASKRSNVALFFIVVCGMLQLVVIPLFSGRGYVVNVIIGVYLITAFLLKRTRWWLILMVAVPIYFTILYGKQLFYAAPALVLGRTTDFTDAFQELSYSRLSESRLFMEPFFKECAHAPISMEMALSMAGKEVPYTNFRDFLFGVTAFVPQRVLSKLIDIPPSVSALNTQLIIDKLIASIPPGFLGHCIYARGVYGLIIGCLCLGALGGGINAVLEESLRRDYRWVVAAVLFGQLYGAFVINGDPKVFIQSDLSVPIWLSLLIAPTLRVINIQRRHR